MPVAAGPTTLAKMPSSAQAAPTEPPLKRVNVPNEPSSLNPVYATAPWLYATLAQNLSPSPVGTRSNTPPITAKPHLLGGACPVNSPGPTVASADTSLP